MCFCRKVTQKSRTHERPQLLAGSLYAIVIGQRYLSQGGGSGLGLTLLCTNCRWTFDELSIGKMYVTCMQKAKEGLTHAALV